MFSVAEGFVLFGGLVGFVGCLLGLVYNGLGSVVRALTKL